MKKITIEDGGSLSLIDENLAALKVIFPTAFSENCIDFDALRTLLGGEIVDSAEKYGLNWHGKKNALQVALSPSFGALRPCREESVDWDSTQNMFIEGDNLEALKLLQRSYSQKIKMIYIDPPYNTGKEFIYPDKWQDNLDTYLRYTGQIDESGDKFSTNTETDGRYHTNWLNMMYPRLKMAWNLLSDDGVIFVSINDKEVHNLRILMDSIFGEGNFITQFIWKTKTAAKGVPTDNMLVSNHEYVLCYQKYIFRFLGLPRSENQYSNPDNDPRGDWKADNMKSTISEKVFSITDPETGIQYTKTWAFSESTIAKMIEEKRIIFPSNGTGTPRQKKFIYEHKNENIPITSDRGVFHTETATNKLKELFDQKKLFKSPKPIELVKFFIQQSTQNIDIILDFFAGSSTTAHAVMQLNAEDGGNRRCISVQLPEIIQDDTEAAKSGYKNIAEIGKERIRRAATHIKNENPNYEGDLGFKVFNLDTSNLQIWNPDRNDLENTLLGYEENIKQDRSEEDVLYELLQKCGEDFATQIKIRKVANKTIHAIGDGAFFACMDKTITEKDVEAISNAIIKWRQELNEGQSECYVYFRDNAFSNDSAKINMDEILQQSGISHVRSL